MGMSSAPFHSARSTLLVTVQFAASGVLALTTRFSDFTPTVLVVGVLGLGLWGWAVVTMRLRQISMQPDVSDGADLVTHGPFRFIRHPMYSGLTLFLLACVLAPFQWWRLSLWIALLAVLNLKAGVEERLLVEQFPGYSDYCRRTKRILPFVF